MANENDDLSGLVPVPGTERLIGPDGRLGPKAAPQSEDVSNIKLDLSKSIPVTPDASGIKLDLSKSIPVSASKDDLEGWTPVEGTERLVGPDGRLLPKGAPAPAATAQPIQQQPKYWRDCGHQAKHGRCLNRCLPRFDGPSDRSRKARIAAKSSRSKRQRRQDS